MLTEPPKIVPVQTTSGLPAPFWSVMIPTYNPRADYLEETLRSVLAQDPGQQQMQIEVVDDCSPGVDVASLVKRIAGERVSFSRTPENLGLAGGWNTCIERSRGQWVHMLHHDDMVLDGFYAALSKGAASDERVGAAFCRHAFCDEDGHWLHLSELHRKQSGVLDDFLERLGIAQLIQTPSIAVKRAIYEELGGFRSDLCYTLDWEMWLRIAARFTFWFEPEILACYRVHQTSATSSLVREAADVRDIRRMLEITMSYQKPHQVAKISRQARVGYAGFAVNNARRMLVLGYARSARKQLVEALRLSKSARVWRQVVSFLFLWVRVAGARLERGIKLFLKIS
jgi:glycosyltransferase involved in cell wall biosynthesis